MLCRLRDRRSRLFSLGLRPCPLRTEIPPDSLNLLIMLCTVEGEISKSLPIFLWGTLFLNISIIFSRICWQTGDPRPIFAPKGLDLSWMLLLYQIIITITCWHQLFQNTSLFNQFTSLLALNCSCPNFFWNVLQVWITGKDVYLQMTWSWPDKTWNILCSYCLQWNTSQSKFRNHYFLFLFAFSILSQLFLIWGCCNYIIVTQLLSSSLIASSIHQGALWRQQKKQTQTRCKLSGTTVNLCLWISVNVIFSPSLMLGWDIVKVLGFQSYSLSTFPVTSSAKGFFSHSPPATLTLKTVMKNAYGCCWATTPNFLLQPPSKHKLLHSLQKSWWRIACPPFMSS